MLKSPIAFKWRCFLIKQGKQATYDITSQKRLKFEEKNNVRSPSRDLRV